MNYYLTSFIPFARLLLVLDNVLFLQHAHTLDLIQVNHETLIIRVKLLNALTTKNCKVIRAVEMFHSLRMCPAQFIRQSFVIFFFEVERSLGEDRIFLDNFIEDVDVERKSLCVLQLLDQLSTDRAAYSVLVVELLNAVGA